MPASERAMTEGMLAFHRAYAGLPSSVIFDEPDCFAYRSAIDFPVFGGVVWQEFGADADLRIQELKERFTGQPLAWLVLPGARPVDIRERLLAAGAHEVVQLQGMLMELEDLAVPPSAPEGVDIVPATTERQVEDYARVFPELFGEPTDGWIDAVIAAELHLFKSPNDPFHRWLAYEIGRPIGAGMVQRLNDETVVLQTLSTLEPARNRGIGQALATRALQAENATQAMVWSSPGARPLYRRMGYRDTFPAWVYVC